jgi:YD repeat-containing protein
LRGTWSGTANHLPTSHRNTFPQTSPAGSLIQKKTDFYLDGDFPLQFVRLYASRNKESREFGPGTRDSLDISIGDLLSIRTPAGKWLHFECDQQHRYRRIADSEGRVVNYDYDQKGRLVRVSDSQGAAEIYRYDDQDQMQAVLDANNNILVSITYSPEGSISSQSLRGGREFRYEYKRNAAGQVFQIQFTDPRGYQTEFSYVGKKYT